MTEGLLRISVEFVGENEKTSTIQFFEPNSKEDLIKIPALDHISREIQLNKTGEYAICFLNLDLSKKTVSFYMLHSEESKNHEKPIGADDVNTIALGLQQLRQKLKQISNNQHMRVEINSAHGDILESVASRIRYCFIFKVILALLIGGCQIWVLQNFFGKKKTIKVTPVSQEMY